MSRALAIRRSSGGIRLSTETILVIAGLALLIWFLMKRKSVPIANYLNKEEWSIKYNEDGLPTSVTIHRDARQT